MRRLIYHIDVNSAYLSWEATEQRKNGAAQDIREIPSIIGGDTSQRKGVVLAKSLPAKSFGIRTGEPVADALKKCPFLQSFPPNFSLYKKYSQQFMAVLKKYAPVVEQVSIDEAYLDMSGLHYFYENEREAAQCIQKEIREELGFTVNVGISSNKLLAKMASDFEKPDKIHTLFPEEIEEKMWPLPIRELFFTGVSAANKLNALGIKTIGDLALSDKLFIQSHLKSHGETLWNYANGIDESPVKAVRDEPKGYGNSITLGKDVTEYGQAVRVLRTLSETVARRLRQDNLFTQTIDVEIKDCHFHKKSHQQNLGYSTNTTDDLYQNSCQLLQEFWDGTPLRLLGIRCTKLTREKIEKNSYSGRLLHLGQEKSGQLQFSLEQEEQPKQIFAKNKEGEGQEQRKKQNLRGQERQKKMEQLDLALDKIKNKYGEESIGRAGVFFLEK